MALLTTSSDIPWELQGWYDRTLLERARPALLFDMFGQTRPLPKNQGKRINFRRYGKLAVNTTPLTDGVTPTGKKLSTTDIYSPIYFYGDYVILTDQLIMTGLDKNIMDICENVLSEQAAESKDTIARDHLVTGTSVRYANNVSARTSIVTAMSDGDVEVVINELKRNDARRLRDINTAGRGVGTSPINASYIAITHPDNEHAVRSLTGFVPVQEYPNRDSLSKSAGEVVEIGAAHDCRFLMTSMAKIWADGGGTAVTNNLRYTTANTACDVYGTLFFAKNAYGIIPLQKETISTIVQKLGSEGSADPLNQRSSVGYKFANAVKITNEDWIWRIEHGCVSL